MTAARKLSETSTSYAATEVPAAAPPRTFAAGRHFLHIFASFAVGGVPVRIANILNHLGRKYRHTIIALDDVYDCKTRLDPGLDVTLFPLQYRKEKKLEALFTFARTLRRLRPDLLLTYNWGAIEWAFTNTFLRTCPHIHFESGFGHEEANGQVRRRVVFRRIALSGAARLVVPSMTLMELAQHTWKIPTRKLVYIPNGVDIVKFGGPADASVIPNFRRQPDELIIGTIAPLRPEKNVGRLLRAFAKMPHRPNVRLLIVGDGSERSSLVALAEALGIADRVVFAGHIDVPEKVFGMLDVFAISSDTEQMPNALLQAMAAGRPVAGVDVGDVKAIVAEENRPFIVAKGDDDGFSRVLDRLLTAPELCASLGARNKARILAEYDQATMFAAYDQLFCDVLAT